MKSVAAVFPSTRNTNVTVTSSAASPASASANGPNVTVVAPTIGCAPGTAFTL